MKSMSIVCHVFIVPHQFMFGSSPPHRDHFNTHNLWARQMAPGYDKLSFDEQQELSAPRFSSVPPLSMFGNKRVANALLNDGIDYNNPWAQIHFNLVEPFKKYYAGDLEIQTLDGNHSDGESHSINYIITRKNRIFAYLSDTGYPFDVRWGANICMIFNKNQMSIYIDCIYRYRKHASSAVY